MFNILEQNANLKKIIHQVLSPLDPIKDLAMVSSCNPQHCTALYQNRRFALCYFKPVTLIFRTRTMNKVLSSLGRESDDDEESLQLLQK
jgi:hypothetical protein